MSLKVRIIPTLLWKGVGLVKGTRFDSWRRVGTIMPAVKVYNSRGVDELILVDIGATNEASAPDYATIEEVAAECFVPLTVGGGVKSVDDVNALLRAGADKVAVNSAAYANPSLIREASDRFGSQCIVASVDFTRRADGVLECVSHCGKTPTGRDVVSWSKELEQLGAGEILLTSADRDGTMEGYDLPALHAVAHAVDIPVIASGGAGSYVHMLEAVQNGAAAIAAAAVFHFTEQTPKEARLYLGTHGVPVRR